MSAILYNGGRDSKIHTSYRVTLPTLGKYSTLKNFKNS